jgi:acetoin utilization protein AcuB
MKTPPPTIRTYMTSSPHVIAPDATMAKAHEVMRALGVRHLPVMRDGRLLGTVSQRDLAIMETLPGVDPHEVPVEDAMATDVYTAPADAPLQHVASEMAARKLGSAVVMDGKEVIGIFTTTDALQALTQVMGLLATP